MMKAIKEAWTDEHDSPVPQAPARSAPMSAEKILRPAFARRDDTPPEQVRERPELKAALSAVMRAAEQIRAADERAERAEHQAAELTAQATAQLTKAEAQIEATQGALRVLEDRANHEAQRAAADRAAAERDAQAAAERIHELEELIRVLHGKLSASDGLLSHAHDRIFAAETRAMEAVENLQYLETQIREQFGAEIA